MVKKTHDGNKNCDCNRLLVYLADALLNTIWPGGGGGGGGGFCPRRLLT